MAKEYSSFGTDCLVGTVSSNAEMYSRKAGGKGVNAGYVAGFGRPELRVVRTPPFSPVGKQFRNIAALAFNVFHEELQGFSACDRVAAAVEAFCIAGRDSAQDGHPGPEGQGQLGNVFRAVSFENIH